jgi:hypothetical protein
LVLAPLFRPLTPVSRSTGRMGWDNLAHVGLSHLGRDNMCEREGKCPVPPTFWSEPTRPRVVRYRLYRAGLSHLYRAVRDCFVVRKGEQYHTVPAAQAVSWEREEESQAGMPVPPESLTSSQVPCTIHDPCVFEPFELRAAANRRTCRRGRKSGRSRWAVGVNPTSFNS